ncbi:MAG: VWA domain-containing protein [Candidatus Heimdallarchaeota archaeon]|nr:VWA domain-containing protein [Candidatus Heimdallarchaeota archaeon]
MGGLELVEFGAQFVNEARNAVHEVPGIKKTAFTSRQSQAIVSLGISRILRLQEELGSDDLVNLAVITSPPEAQKYSEMIALRIIFGDVTDVLLPEFSVPEVDIDDPPDPQIDPQIKAQHLLLQEVLEFLNLQKSVDLEKGLEELRFAESVEEEIYSSDPKKYENLKFQQKLDLANKRISYEQIEGREGILKQHLSSWDDIYQEARKSMMKSIPFMQHQDIVNSHFMGLNGEISKMSREKSVKDLSKIIEGTREPATAALDKYEKLVNEMTYRELSNALDTLQNLESTMQRMGIESSDFAPSFDRIEDLIADRLRGEAANLDDVLSHPNVFDESFTREQLDTMVENTMKYSTPMEMLEKTKAVDDLFGTNLSSSTFDKYHEMFDDLTLDDLIQTPVSSSEWLESFGQKLEEEYNSEELNWEEQKRVAEDLLNLRENIGSDFIAQQLEEELEHFVERMIESSTEPDQLAESIDFARDNNIPYNPQKVRDKGKELGMSNEEIARLLGGAYEYIKSMIETHEDSYEKVHVLLDKAPLTTEQRQNLVDLSIEEGAEGALGALAAVDLEQVTSSIPQTEEGKELLEKALGAGGGENLLHQWFEHGAKLPPWLRQIVKDHAKRIMIDLAKKKAASLIGSSEAGPLPEGSTRPYYLGDDPDTIDIDETIDNILDQGKQIKDVQIDDFIVRKTVTGRRCVIFLVDISGSMSGAPLASASIVTAMLLITFARDELGVALFESDTHVLCEVDESIVIDEVVDKVLDIDARGGTQMQAALSWAEKQFDLSRSEDKMFIMVSDAGLGDFGRCEPHMRKIADLGATSTLIVPHTGFGMGNIQSILNAANAELITVHDWKKFPEIVSEILSRA